MLSAKEFQKAYSLFLGKAWSSGDNYASAQKNPVASLNGAGFDIPQNATVALSGAGSGGNMAEQYDMYRNGFISNSFNITLPATPPTNVKIAGSPETATMDLDAPCCCCCPSCTCT